jgi:AraC-like DNA-binding protein
MGLGHERARWNAGGMTSYGMVTSGHFVSTGPNLAPGGWQSRVSDLHGKFRIDVPDQQAPYHGRIDWHATELYRMVCWVGEPERLIRDEPQVRADPVPMYELVVPLEGEMILETKARSTKLAPGEMALVSLNAPVATTHTTRCRAMGFLIPESEVRGQFPPLAPSTFVGRRTGLGNVAFESMRSLNLQAANMTSPEFDAVARHLLDMVMLASRTQYSDTVDHAADIEAAIRHQIRQRASDPTLNGESLALALGWSLRQIQHILQRAGTTPSELIRTERLQAARELLIAPDRDLLTVGQVALRCGFGSHAAFCRAFRAQFGTSPRAMRIDHAREVKESAPDGKV